jgi:hypothetical protein
MDRNSIIGIVLIALIFVVWSIISNPVLKSCQAKADNRFHRKRSA